MNCRPKTKKHGWCCAWCWFWAAAIALRVGLDAYFPLEHKDLIAKYSEEFSLKDKGLDEHYVAAVICTESRFNEKAESAKGAVGLMQILPDTGAMGGGKDRHQRLYGGQLVRTGGQHPYRLLVFGVPLRYV